ncbi:GGDEF domain-containing protein [Ruminococcus sp.]|uniref:GGDEF domain-containing protein n=1 Tax=Ruminococcus sp. TaxID=41978 RepID=UPI00258E7462|nr:GGDEF domain-containing protein [Ruminococcus sp.]MCR5019873.1 GGDEF domain-containing protein [Ruminococcus sp.]
MLERIKRFALYGDTDAESYDSIKRRLEESNRTIAFFFASVASVLIFAMYLLSFTKECFSSSRNVFIFGMVFSLIQVAVSLAAKKWLALSYVSVYMAVSVFLIYGIAIATITRPEEQTVTFMVMLIFVPLIFVDRPIRMAGSLLTYIIAFIIMAHITKTDPVLSVDVTDAVIFGALSVVSEAVVYRAKIKGYVLENKLKVMSETDQLTGLNNRNCYEWRITEYQNMFKKAICCVYIDANGLHELNNTKGHKAGDEMLCFVAECVEKQFGRRDSYRVGGDEFVAFAADIDREEIEKRIDNIRISITERGYHAAIGYEYHTRKSLKINELIRLAESKMFDDKAAYYSTFDRRVRK